MPNIGPLEIAIVLLVVLLIFGPKKLPELGRSMGRGIREFKNSLTRDHDDEPEAPTLTEGEAQPHPSVHDHHDDETTASSSSTTN